MTRTSHKTLYEQAMEYDNVLTNEEFVELKRRIEEYNKY